MFEIIERSCTTGAVAHTYSGFATVEAAEDYAADLEADNSNEGYWYDVAQEGTV